MTQIVDSSFEWLTGDCKVASKAYAMRILYEAGKLKTWIYPEMEIILESGYPKHSAAYKSAAKDVLKKIRKSL